jgi:hypothetical protein
MSKVLHLTLKSKWFDMIEARIKKEEYREINPYWAKRFLMDVSYHVSINHPTAQQICDYIIAGSSLIAYDLDIQDHIRFARGGHFHSSIPQMVVECEGIKIGTGNPEWGAEPGKKYFVIKLGERISGGVININRYDSQRIEIRASKIP